MGAFIAYLYRAEGIRHFFVLAPNLTIYNKLIADFTPNTPKYVFQGIAEFATNPPEIITGDNYETGRGVRAEQRAAVRSADEADPHQHLQHLQDQPRGPRRQGAPHQAAVASTSAKATSSTWPKLDDLVLLMDESHRYRAIGGRAGDQRTAADSRPGTDRHAAGRERQPRPIPFKNVIYSYPLARGA